MRSTKNATKRNGELRTHWAHKGNTNLDIYEIEILLFTRDNKGKET